ncbi:MAG: DNA N-6-adenine-methyltransferase [Pseudomonadota bacterium]
MPSYETAKTSDDWYTPGYIFNGLGEVFDLDVAAPPGGPRHVPCDRYIAPPEDALEMGWEGFVWMNPPFGHQSTKRAWLRRFFDHGSGIALVPDRTSAPWFQEYAPMADAILWVSPKVKFERPDGSIGESPGTGTCLFASGRRATAALVGSNLGIVTLGAIARIGEVV